MPPDAPTPAQPPIPPATGAPAEAGAAFHAPTTSAGAEDRVLVLSASEAVAATLYWALAREHLPVTVGTPALDDRKIPEPAVIIVHLTGADLARGVLVPRQARAFPFTPTLGVLGESVDDLELLSPAGGRESPRQPLTAEKLVQRVRAALRRPQPVRRGS